MVSFDVKFLFTKLHLNETIEIIGDYLYSNNAEVTPVPPFKKTLFIKLVLAVLFIAITACAIKCRLITQKRKTVVKTIEHNKHNNKMLI